MKPCFIGFDCGTMGTKVALYDIEGHCLAQAFAENEFSCPHHMVQGGRDKTTAVEERIPAKKG